jgi:phosphomannomutase/phosphoglucomutase
MVMALKSKEPKAPRTKSTLANRVIGAAGLSAIVLLVATVAVQMIASEREAMRATERARVAAAAAADRLGAEVEGLRRLLHALAATTMRDTPSDRDAAATLEQLRPIVGERIRLRLVPAGTTDPDAQGPLPISFSTIELVRRAERGATILPVEMHQVGTPDMHAAVAVPVAAPGNGRLRGLLIAALPAAVVQQALDGLGRQGGRYELVQRVADRSVSLVTSKGAPPAAGRPAVEVDVPGTIWRVAVSPQSPDAVDYAFAAAVAGPGMLLLLLIGWTWGAWLRRDYDADAALVVAAARGRPVARRANGALATRLADTARLVLAFGNGAREAAAEPAAAEGARPRAPVAPVTPAPLPLAVEQKAPPALGGERPPVPESVFRMYDVRGLVDEAVTVQFAYELGRAIGSAIFERGEQQVAVGRDGRPSSQPLCEALVRGLVSSGRDVVDIGLVPTPVLYFAAMELGSGCGVMVTGSHNAPQYNGFKLMMGGETPTPEQIQALRERMVSGDLLRGTGTYLQRDFNQEYIQRIVGDISLIRPLKIVVDAGNGAAGRIAPTLFRQIGCEVYELYCEVDGSFPNHHPDPSQPQNVEALGLQVQALEADIGIAFDGDGDRLGVVDGHGRVVWPDQVLMLLAGDILLRNPGADIVYDVKSTRHLPAFILSSGGRPVMWKSGHSLMKAKMRETGALLGGEFSGHIFFKERWYGFDDALYAAARLLEVLSSEARTPDEVFDDLPRSPATPELSVPLAEGASFVLMRRLGEVASFPDARIVSLDGLRVEFGDGWGLVRASNTSPALTFRFEADDDEALARIQAAFRTLVNGVAPYVTLPF